MSQTRLNLIERSNSDARDEYKLIIFVSVNFDRQFVSELFFPSQAEILFYDFSGGIKNLVSNSTNIKHEIYTEFIEFNQYFIKSFDFKFCSNLIPYTIAFIRSRI